MVRVPGSSGDSGFHRESTEDVKIKEEPGKEASAERGSPPTLKNKEGSTDQESARRSFIDDKGDDLALKLEMKPEKPPQAPHGAPAAYDFIREPPDGDRPSQIGKSPSSDVPTSQKAAKMAKAAPTRRRLKAPDQDVEDRQEIMSWLDAHLDRAFYWTELKVFMRENPVMKILQPEFTGEAVGVVTPLPSKKVTNKLQAARVLVTMLEEAGFTPAALDADRLFKLELSEILDAAESLPEVIAPVVGLAPPTIDPPEPQRSRAARDLDALTGSSQYASAESEDDSDSSVDLERMTMGPAASHMLQRRRETRFEEPPDQAAPQVAAAKAVPPPDRRQSFFDAAMARFLREQQAIARAPAQPRPQAISNVPDVDMESVESVADHQGEYDPDDLSIAIPRRPAIATAEVVESSGPATTRIRVSAISELKEFSGKDRDEDRARSWLGKVKSAFVRDQAPDNEKCLVLGDLLAGPARTWFRQLSRTTRSNWKTLYEEFSTEFCGRGTSVRVSTTKPGRDRASPLSSISTA